MKSLNNCQFIGNLGMDPEVRYMPDGTAVTKMSLACGESYKDKSGEQVERTEWVRIVAFGKLAEICGEYLRKGSRVYFAGRMKTNQWEKDGVKQYTTEVVAEKMIMLDSKSGQSGTHSDYPAAGQGPGRQQPSPATPNFDNFDDDIPF